MKIACWSGPRNLSTAMMYAFAARGDCAVWDEPFYAAYLSGSGSNHPMRDAILASQPADPAAVVSGLLGGQMRKPYSYFKLLTHHMLAGFPLDWAEDCVNVHLIRHPARVIASYAKKREAPTLEDIGFVQQLALLDQLGGVVVDSYDIRRDPARALQRLCDAIGLEFTPAMLTWPEGPKHFDGVWAPHWYDAVHRSTGFAGPEGPLPELTGEAQALCDAAMPLYRALSDRVLT
ncbi:MAG: HAD family hydrolase [Pseudomonadota bacterium]